MKILLLVPEYPPFTIGGGGQIYANLAKNYLKIGHQVTVVYGYYPTTYFQTEIKVFTKNKIKFYELPLIPTPRFLPDFKIRMPLNFKSLSKIDEIIAQEKPDVAHLHGYGFPMIDTWSRKLTKYQIPYLLTIHGWPIKHHKSNLFTKYLTQIYLDNFSTLTLRNSQRISTVSKFLKTQIPQEFQNKTSIVYNPFEISKNFKKTQKAIDFKKEITLLSLGRLSFIKGFQEIIKLLPYLISEGINVKYLIAGMDEGYKKELEKLVQKLSLKKQIKFLGQLNEKNKWKYLKQTDFVAIPSLIEGFGLVSLEAVICNKFIIYGKSEAIQEVLCNYPNKVSLYDKNLASKLKKMPINNSHKFDLSPFKPNKIAKKYLKILESIKK